MIAMPMTLTFLIYWCRLACGSVRACAMQQGKLTLYIVRAVLSDETEHGETRV